MQENKSISQPISGMMKDVHSSQLQPQQYRLAVNVNTSNEVDGFMVQNEPSNYYGVNFPQDYKVIGTARTEPRTYYFITSITTDEDSEHYRRSSIGYVDNNVIETFNQDEPSNECNDCGRQLNILDTPLEEIEQEPSHEYIELVNDRCISANEIEEYGLNFNINFPIKKVDIKQEKLGTVLYWEDWRNPSRFLQVTRIEEAKENDTFDYLHTLDVACEDPQEAPCIDVDKMLVFPKHKRMWIEAKTQQIGGNLKKGTYEFWGAYCDINGNETTEYCTPTNPISVWDEYNNILEQTELDEFTNYAIKLQIHNLDTEHYKYYKVAVVERNNVLNTQSVFLSGIYPTTDDIVVYTHSGSSNDDLYITRGNVSLKKRMYFNQLSAIKPLVNRAKGSMVSDKRRFIFGIETPEELNLQPVVNLFSSLLHWQTSAASENLYKSFIATSKYKQYTRNEVQPFSIRFLYDNGGYSANFPFVGRPMIDGDDDTISDINYQSVNSLAGSCNKITRDRRWQIYNTAYKYTEPCTDYSDGGIELEPETLQKSCYITEVDFIPSGSIRLGIDETFTDLESYINLHIEDICNVSSLYYNEDFCNYLSDEYDKTCENPFSNNFCEEASLVSTENIIGSVVGEVTQYTEEDEKDITSYQKSVQPSFCYPFKRDTSNGAYTEDTEFTETNKFTPCTGNAFIGWDRKPVFIRDGNFQNESCNYPKTIQTQTDPTQSFSSTYLNYQASETEADLYDTNVDFISTPATGFKDNLHNHAQFFKLQRKVGEDRFLLEFTKQSGCLGSGDYFEELNNTKIRYTIYKSCDITDTIVASEVIDLSTDNLLKVVDVSTYTETSFIVAIDTAIVTEGIDDDCDLGIERDVYFLAPPCSCFGIYKREIEYDSVTVNWGSISIDKRMTYEALCTFTLPNINGCDIVPFEKGVMAYWESTLEYPDNKQLYDSSFLKIKPSDISIMSEKDKEEFLNYYVDGGSTDPSLDVNGNYILNDVDFRCKKIRHPKLPDNTIAPYIIDTQSFKNNAESIIFPLGVNIDSKAVVTMLNVAYANGMITQKQRASIVGWEILKGDNSIHKSVISNGIGFDMIPYQKGGENIHYANFPFNDLGENKMLLNQDGNLIQHPTNGQSNHLFSYISPDLFLTSPTIPSEMTLQGYLVGSSDAGVAMVDKHPKWTVLGKDSYKAADALAVAELALDLAIKVADFITQSGAGHFWFFGGPAGAGSSAASVGFSWGTVAVFSAASIAKSFVNYGKLRNEWLQTFRNLGRADNFATFKYATSNYNKLLKAEQDDSYIRRLSIRKYLKDGDYNVVDEIDGNNFKVNNFQREHSALLSTSSQYVIDFNTEYQNIDNNKKSINTSSNFIGREAGCDLNSSTTRNVASPYFSLKNYIPDQWDGIDSIKWLTTNYIFDLDTDTSCTPIYGGNSVISRFNWRRKVPFFRVNDIGSPDKLPYKYSQDSNIGQARFYCDYETADDNIFNYLGVNFPDLVSNYEFDCQEGKYSYYLRPPSKFYLFSHSVVDFLVESEINCNFRYGKKQPKDQFYNGQSLQHWLQETNLPISEPNTFYYNNTYTLPVSNSPQKKLDRTYDKEIWNKRRFYNNAWIWSEKDNNENALIDQYRIYKPLNFWEDESNKGMLIDLRSIESDQFLGRYENQLQLFNQINPYADSINSQNRELGTGFLYARPINFKSTDLGFAGTQNTDFVSTVYGHFWSDAKRGRIFQVDQNGGNMEVISETIQGKPSGMKNWFREHLPYKILKHLPEIDIDNKYKGIGMNIWYDDRFSRVFFTKRDYVLKPGVNKNLFSYNKETQQLLYNDVEVFFDNETLFKDVSFTISYKPTEGMWNSYFTFYPDYSIAHNGYFQTGFNWGQHKETLWNHLLNNSSFGVFQGEYNPFIIEFPVSNQQANKILASLAIDVEARRYQNQWDYTVNPEVGVTDMFIYNSKQNSGHLVLNPQRVLTDNRKYPRVIDGKQHILTTFDEGKQNINYFFNRVLDEKSNIPHLIKDENNIFSTIDSRNVKFSGKKILERMKGADFIVNISNTKNSQFNILIKNIINSEIIEP